MEVSSSFALHPEDGKVHFCLLVCEGTQSLLFAFGPFYYFDLTALVTLVVLGSRNMT